MINYENYNFIAKKASLFITEEIVNITSIFLNNYPTTYIMNTKEKGIIDKLKYYFQLNPHNLNLKIQLHFCTSKLPRLGNEVKRSSA